MILLISAFVFHLYAKSQFSYDIRGLSKKFVEFVNKNKTTIPIAFKFVYNYDVFTADIIAKF